MGLSSWTYDSADLAPMLEEQFQLVLDATQIRQPQLKKACRDVLVEGLLATEAAQRHKIDNVNLVYRAIKTLKDKAKEICAAEGWVATEVWLVPPLTDVLIEFQRDQIRRYKESKEKKRRRKT